MNPTFIETMLETGLFEAFIMAIDTDQLYTYGYYSVSILGVLEQLLDAADADIPDEGLEELEGVIERLHRDGKITTSTFNFIKEQTAVFILEK